MAEKYRVGVIGSTGRGNYGHGLDRVWLDLPETEIVAVADDDAGGLAAAAKRLGAPKAYRDYRELLTREEPDLVSICPRWLDQHRDMVLAAVGAGVHGIYLEKPFCQDLAQADAIVAACEKAGTKLAIAHQTRYSPVLPAVREIIDGGGIGRVLEFRARGKEDRRGGGEDLWVLGTHVLNLVHHFGGEPLWCSAAVYQGDEPVAGKHVKDGPEGIGPLAGDHVRATYALDRGATAYFNSVRDARGDPSRFGLTIYGSKGVIDLHTGHLPAAHWLADPSWTPGRSGKRWVPVTSAGPGLPEPEKDGGLHAGNVAACRDLITAVEDDRQPESSLYEARTATEMIAGVFESHRLRRPVDFPLANRRNPLALLRG